ncbi:MAG: DnaA/Hda family protein [Nitrospirota bacterium]
MLSYILITMEYPDTQLIIQFPLNPEFSLENFIVCPENEVAYRAVVEMVQDNHLPFNPLFIYGESGSGKTHLLTAASKILDVTEIINLKGEVEAGLSSFIQKALLIDNIHLISPEVSKEVFRLFNKFYIEGKKIIITSLLPPNQRSNVDEHLGSRLSSGMVVRLSLLNDETRLKIMKKIAKDSGFDLTEEVASYILTHVRRDIGSLQDALKRAIEYSLMTKQRLTVPLVRKVIHAGDT